MAEMEIMVVGYNAGPTTSRERNFKMWKQCKKPFGLHQEQCPHYRGSRRTKKKDVKTLFEEKICESITNLGK